MNATIERPSEAAPACMVAQVALDAVQLLVSTGHTVVGAASGSEAGVHPWVAISVAEVVDATGWLFGAESRNVATADGGLVTMVDGEWRGVSYELLVSHKIAITVIVDDDEVEPAVMAIARGAATGSIGDGLITVSALESCFQISAYSPPAASA